MPIKNISVVTLDLDIFLGNYKIQKESFKTC